MRWGDGGGIMRSMANGCCALAAGSEPRAGEGGGRPVGGSGPGAADKAAARVRGGGRPHRRGEQGVEVVGVVTERALPVGSTVAAAASAAAAAAVSTDVVVGETPESRGACVGVAHRLLRPVPAAADDDDGGGVGE